MSFKPFFGNRAWLYNSLDDTPPQALQWENQPCACWASRGRTQERQGPNDPAITAQLALASERFFQPLGWSGQPLVWSPRKAWSLIVGDDAGNFLSYFAVWVGYMWTGTPDAHLRYDLTPFVYTPPVGLERPLLWDQLDSAFQGRETTLSIYRPFGSGTLLTAGVACYMYPGTRGQVASNFAFNFPDFDNVLIVGDGVDIRDGNTRTVDVDGATFHDGDEVRVPSGSGNSRYVVVRVERTLLADGSPAKRVFILRDTAVWPGP